MDHREVAGPSLERGVVFQGHALMPWLTVRKNVGFAVRSKWPNWTSAQVDAQVEKYVGMVGLSHAIDKKPSQLSGGMKQRVGIARAFAGGAKVVVADEPVSALDVSVQAAVTDLLMDIQRENKTTLLFISHDLSIVRYLSDRVLVMYLGHVVEMGTTDQVFQPPYHPYTEALLSAVPIADPRVTRKRIVLQGDIPSAMNPPPGCPFQTRCRWKDQVAGGLCDREMPPVQTLADGHQIKCHLRADVLAKMEPVIQIAAE
jgi:peptide/nickel transport system ATP-binding protein